MDKNTSPTRTQMSSIERDALLREAKAQRMQTILENDEKMRVHHHNKLEKSSAAFANTKVTSCTSVLMTNGMSIAMPFRSTSNNRHNNRKGEKLQSFTQ